MSVVLSSQTVICTNRKEGQNINALIWFILLALKGRIEPSILCWFTEIQRQGNLTGLYAINRTASLIQLLRIFSYTNELPKLGLGPALKTAQLNLTWSIFSAVKSGRKWGGDVKNQTLHLLRATICMPRSPFFSHLPSQGVQVDKENNTACWMAQLSIQVGDTFSWWCQLAPHARKICIKCTVVTIRLSTNALERPTACCWNLQIGKRNKKTPLNSKVYSVYFDSFSLFIVLDNTCSPVHLVK